MVRWPIAATDRVVAITASTYVVASSRAGTIERVRGRIVGTITGVPSGLACLPSADHLPIMIWVATAVAMIIYAVALPEWYDIACAAFAFTLIVTMAATGDHSFAHACVEGLGDNDRRCGRPGGGHAHRAAPNISIEHLLGLVLSITSAYRFLAS
ncbi:FUSC family protein [Tunturiibacter gelidiferens]|uniref:FUSC family protein n=1 Tax=Tunturiibacter gelidiferens TaxID=3069689 RepID=UPI003D9B2463